MMFLQAVLTAAGKPDALGSLEENDPDADDEELEDDDVAGLADQLSAAAIQ